MHSSRTKICRGLLALFTLIVPFRALADGIQTSPADDLTAEAHRLLGLDPEAALTWTLLDRNDSAPDSALPNTVYRIWHLPGARGRQVFRVDFAAPFVSQGSVFHIYLDADDDRATGRSSGGAHQGVDVMLTVSNGFPSATFYAPAGTVRGGNHPRLFLAGDSIYLSVDIPTRQQDGRSVFSLHTAGYLRDGERQSATGSGRRRQTYRSAAEPDREPVPLSHVAVIDTTDFAIGDVDVAVLHSEEARGLVRARVTWRTNWIGPGVVEYGPADGELDLRAAGAFSTRNHRVMLDALEPDRVYAFRVRSMTPAGGEQVSARAVFSTAAPDRPAPAFALRRTPLRVANRSDHALADWPVSAGVPFAQGEIASTAHLQLRATDGSETPAGWTVLSRWPDGSLRWVRVDFRAVAPAAGESLYEVAYGAEVTPSSGASALRVSEDGEGIRVDTGTLVFTVGRSPFEPFREVYRRGPDGTLVPVAAGPLAGQVVDGDGAAYDMRHGLRELAVEEAGPERVVIRAVGDHVGADGNRLLEWQLRLVAYPGRDFVRVFHTFGVNDVTEEFSEFRSLSLTMPAEWRAGDPVALGGDRPIEVAPSAGGRTRLLQAIDDAYTVDVVGERMDDGRRAAGWIRAGTAALALRDFWQHYPKSLEAEEGALAIGIAPALARDQYSAWPEREHVLFAPYRNGVYRFRQGFAKRHELLAHFGADDPAPDMAVFNAPPVVSVMPERFRDARAFGRIAIAADLPPRFAGYTDAVRDWLDRYLAVREGERLYGMMHFGDWYGERAFNWGNMEYDTPHGLFLQFAASGDPAFFEVGQQAARHFMDVDTVHYTEDPRRVGLVWVHAMLHTGGYYEQGDPRFGIAYPQGHAENFGHMWANGLADYHWLTGDLRAREVLLNIADMTASYFVDTRAHVRTIARVPGWMSMILLAAHEVTGDAYYLNAARTIFDYWIEWQTPSGAWTRRLARGHCNCDTPHHGNAGFMVAVLGTAMKQYHGITGDERVADSLVRAMRWMIEDLWVERDAGFRYTSCPAQIVGGGAFHMIEPVAYAHALTGDPLFADVVLRSADRRLMSPPGDSKAFSSHIRAVPHTLADLVPATEAAVLGMGGPGPHTVLLRKDAGEPLRIRLRGRGDGPLAVRAELSDMSGNPVADERIAGRDRMEWVYTVPADAGPGTYTLRLFPEGAAAWEAGAEPSREVVQLSETTGFGDGVAAPMLRFRVEQGAEAIELRLRGAEPGGFVVRVLDPNGEERARHGWTEEAGGAWQDLRVPVPPFEPVTVGFSPRGVLNEGDRTWTLAWEGGALSVLAEGAAPFVSGSPLALFDPARPAVQVEGNRNLAPGDEPVVSLDASGSRGWGAEIVNYTWDFGDGATGEGPRVEHRYVEGGNYRVLLTLTDALGRRSTENVSVHVAPPELAGIDRAGQVLVNAPDFSAQEGGRVRVTPRVGSHGRIITAWEGSPGHRLTWDVPIPESGSYRLLVKFATDRQNTTRTFHIDGGQPFPEMDAVPFPYTGGWSQVENNWDYRILSRADGTPMVFTLEAGTRRLSVADRTGGLAVDYFVFLPGFSLPAWEGRR